ncbi:MAG: DNA-binding protein [Alphaproteobacteria bacterium]|nr:MAG: DNA-binding protein [Alphaproteobacteria bacterium]
MLRSHPREPLAFIAGDLLVGFLSAPTRRQSTRRLRSRTGILNYYCGSVKMEKSNVAKQTYSGEEVREALGLSVPVVKRMISKGDIESIKIGGSRRVTARQLEDYLRSRESAAGWKPAA